MGIRDMLRTLHQNAKVLWEYINGNINTSDASLFTEIGASNISDASLFTEIGASNTSDASLYTEVRASKANASEIVTPAGPPNLRCYARSQLRLGGKIAEGGQAVIYEAQMSSTFSIKLLPVVVKKFTNKPDVVQGLFPLEFDTYKSMFVCKPYGFFFDDDAEPPSLCMIMDRYSYDLHDLIDSEMKLRPGGPPFTELVAVSIIIQLALGLRGLHEKGIYHRDLKSQNILVQKNLNKILIPSGAVDMNFAIAISDFEASENVKGSRFWRAPEVLQCSKEKKPTSGIQWQKADVYSFGMTCYEILTGRIPFDDHDGFSSAYNVVMSGGRPELPAHIVPVGLKDIVQRCWRQEPKDRPTFDEIMSLLKDKYEQLWADGFREVESLMSWESSLGTVPKSILQELARLVRQVVTDTTGHKLGMHRKIASKFACTAERFVRTAEKFVSKFDWRSFATHPSKPFAEFVEREGLYTLMSWLYSEECDICDEFVLFKDEGFDRNTRIVRLMERVYFTATDEHCHSIYSAQYDEGLMLSDKLSIIEKAFVEPLLDAEANKQLIFMVAKRLLHEELSISRFLVSKCVVRLQKIVGSPVVEFLVEHIFSFPSMRILSRHFFTEHDVRLCHFLKVFLDQLAIDLFLPVITLFLQLKLLEWRGLLGWWLVKILKSFCSATRRSREQSFKFSYLVSHSICYVAVCCFLEMHWVHYLAMTMK